MPDAPDVPLDRRPLASRELAVFRWLAARLVELRVSANSISIAGLVAGLIAGAALAATSAFPAVERALWLAAAAGVQLRLLANMLDGMVAIGSGTSSRLGELYNEVPDRISDTAILVGLGCAAGGSPSLGFVAAIAALLTAYVRTVAKNAGAPMDFCGPMAKPHRMFTVTVTALYLALAPQSWRPEWPGRPELGLPAMTLALIVAGSLVTAVRRLARAARALRGGER